MCLGERHPLQPAEGRAPPEVECSAQKRGLLVQFSPRPRRAGPAYQITEAAGVDLGGVDLEGVATPTRVTATPPSTPRLRRRR